MQIKTLTTGPNAGTTYYVDNNGKFMRLATHSNPAVNVEAFNESKGYTTPAPATPTPATPEAGPQMQIKDVSPTIKVDYVGPDGTFTAAPAQPAAPVDTTVSGTIEAPASGTMKDPLPPAAPAIDKAIPNGAPTPVPIKAVANAGMPYLPINPPTVLPIPILDLTLEPHLLAKAASSN